MLKIKDRIREIQSLKLHRHQLTQVIAPSSMHAREVALKRIVPHARHLEGVVERLFAEGAMLQELGGECGIVCCHEVIASPPTLVLESVAGGSLAARFMYRQDDRSAECDSIDEAMPTFRAVARAVGHVHARGIIHRDIKPSNILFTADGELRLVDFSVAVRRGARSTAEGWEDVDVGTLGYAAPELLRDPATANTETVDIYGLGALLHELVLGCPPHMMHGDETELDLRARILAGAPRDITPRESTLSPPLRFLLDSALAPDPAVRPQSVAELLTLLDAL